MKKCPFCAEQIQDAATVCKHCGRDIPPPTPAQAAAQAKTKKNAGVGCLVVVIVIVLIVAVSNLFSHKSQVTGTAVWQPVDSGHGYAIVTLTNAGSSAATAKCTVTATDDFGDEGIDSFVGVPVPAGQTVTAKMALTVTGNGAFKVNKVTVTGC